MPRHLPPIAPRGPAEPEAAALPNEIHNLPVVPTDDPLARVKALARRPDRYITEPNPFTMALWSALNEPVADVIARHAVTLAYATEAIRSPLASDEPGERQITASAARPAVTAITAVMDATVVAAIQGDSRAREMIAARIEGNPGQRRGDIDPEAEAQRARVRGTIEQIVRDMARRATDAEAIDVTPTNSDLS